MSNDNFAIDIETEAAQFDEDVEANLSTSRCALMSFEEEQPVSLVASIKESVKSSKRKITYYTSFITSPIKKLLSTFKLLIIIGLYSFLGAHLFMYFEVSADLAAKEETYHQRKIAREVMILNLRAIYYDNRQDYEERWKHAILRFESDLELDEPSIETAWTFWMSFLYAGTIFTTIGYGNIACKTTSGQVATMIYAFAGIPIMLVMLNSLNNFLLKWIKIIANYMSDTVLYLGIKFGMITIRQDEKEKLKRYKAYIKKYKLSESVMYASGESGLNNIAERVSIDMMSKEDDEQEDADDEEVPPDPPVISTIFATVSWIMLSAMIFCMFEDWSFFTSFYFCFISLTTIGLGDVTPANPEYMIATFGVVIVGLSMLTVCIDVVKEKIALMYMAILQKLLKDYMEAVKNGDPNAASAMMAGFQGKAKFLMPLLSKNDGAKVMNKFKQDCSKKGIDPPPVLTNINPETGMPAFASAQKEDFHDYIEVAEGLAAEEKSQTYMSKSSIDNLLLSRQNSTSMQVPKMNWDTSRRHSMISEVAKITIDGETQTVMLDIFEIGVQANIESQKQDSSTQYITTTCHTIGIQPEVSSIYHYNPLFSSDDSESEDYISGSDDESEDYSRTEESILGDDVDDKKMIVPVEEPLLTAAPATEQKTVPENKKIVEFEEILSEKQASQIPVEDQILVGKTKNDFDVTIEKKQDLEAELISEPKEPEISAELLKPPGKKRKRKKNKSLTVLRFLKSSGMQTEVPTSDGSTQYDIVDKSNRRCQTKMSSITSDMVEKRQRNLTVEKAKNFIIEQERVGERSETVAENGFIVNEVYLDVNLISLGVDEVGHVVDVPNVIERETTSIASISSSDDESDDLEFLFTNSSMQTDEMETFDKETHASPASLKMISDCNTQTTISTFHRPPKVAETTIVDDAKREEIHFMEEVGVQTRHTSFYIKDEEKTEDTIVDQDDEIPLFLEDNGTQTTSDNVQVDTQTDQLETLDRTMQTDPTSKIEEIVIVDARNHEVQTDLLEVFDQSWQTESIHLEASYSQTDVLEKSDTSNQTTWKIVTNSSQTIEIDRIDQTNQTDLIEKTIESANSLCQTDVVSIYEQSIQTDVEEKHNFGLQVELSKECEDQANQTNVEVEELEVQTEIDLRETSQQTDYLFKYDALNQAGSGVFEQTSSSTQHDGGSQADKFCQSDIQMKNKRTQIDDDLASLEEFPISDISPEINLESLSGGPLWSDFDYMHDENEGVDDEVAAAADFEQENQEKEEEISRQTEQTLPQTSHVLIQANPVETSSTTVQAVADTCDTSAGLTDNDDWLQVYVQELDEARRLRMSDIGIQTGVLARVQHMYTRPISDDVTSTSLAPITLRKDSDSSESPAANFDDGSQESLIGANPPATTSTAPSTSIERKSSIRRTKSLKKVRVSSALGDSRSKSEKSETSNIVNDLRAKFEGGSK